MRYIPTLSHKVGLIDDIFGRLYGKVGQEYYSLVVFALQRCEQVGIIATENDFLRYSEENTVMFYYQPTASKEVNFIMFDKRLKFVQFGTGFINKFNKKYPSEHLKFKDFCDQLFKEGAKEKDLFGREEMESDEEDRPRFEQMSLAAIKTELKQYLNKDLSQLQSRIEKLLEELQNS